jgi:hypothetical protein
VLGLVDRRALEVLAMQLQDRRDRIDRGRSSLPRELGGDEVGLLRQLAVGQILLTTTQVREDEPGDGRARAETDDEQPPVELGVHAWADTATVTGKRTMPRPV